MVGVGGLEEIDSEGGRVVIDYLHNFNIRTGCYGIRAGNSIL